MRGRMENGSKAAGTQRGEGGLSHWREQNALMAGGGKAGGEPEWGREGQAWPGSERENARGEGNEIGGWGKGTRMGTEHGGKEGGTNETWRGAMVRLRGVGN